MCSVSYGISGHGQLNLEAQSKERELSPGR
jgi:hypothetical protein